MVPGADADQGKPVLAGELNNEKLPTQIMNTIAGDGLSASGAGNGSGVVGFGAGTGYGVRGLSRYASGVGVSAENIGGGAGLKVLGPAMFSRSGSAMVPAGSKRVTVSVFPLTISSLVLATVQDPGSIFVTTAVPNTDQNQITISVNKPPASPLRVAWFVVN
jgi:hypothetical protein